MAQTYIRLLYHVVFSTKDRAPQLTPAIHPYLGGIVKRLGGVPFKIGGVADHVHLLVSIPATMAVSDFMRDLKAGSSGWMRKREPTFQWQRGYVRGLYGEPVDCGGRGAVHCEPGGASREDRFCR
jgi:putative transposase